MKFDENLSGSHKIHVKVSETLK